MFVNYKLYRTLPKLSGNVKWDLIVEKVDDEWQVVDFHLRPISKYIPYTLINGDYLLNSPHQLNLKKFYEDTISQFYDNPIDPLLSSDWPMIVPKDYNEEQVRHIKNWDDTYWCGTQRMRTELYGKTHECLIPVWLEKVKNQLVIKIISSKDYVGSVNFESVEKEIEIKFNPCELPTTFHERFSNYLFNYLEYCGITEGNNNIISIDFTNKKCTLKGLEVKSGNIITRNDENITKNLVARERPLLEQNSIITNAFRDDELILCQLFNFNVVFNDTDILDNYGSSYIKTEIEIDDTIIEHRDFYTNHYNIPRFPINYTDDNEDNKGIRIGEREYDSYDFKNALDYLEDCRVTELMHKNKIVQPLCHWSPIDSNILFNVYDGFGNTFIKDNKIQYIKHCIGNIEDPLSTEANDNQNWNWLGYWQDSSGDVIVEGDKNKHYLIEYHDRLLSSLSFTKLDSYINNLKWDTDDLDEDVYFATTYWGNLETIPINDYFSLLGSINKKYEFRINIWLDRKEYYYNNEDNLISNLISTVSSLPNFGTIVCMLDNFYGNLYNESYAKSVYNNEEYLSYGTHDHMYDCTKYTDFNNNFYELLKIEDDYVRSLISDHSKLNGTDTKFEILTIDYIKKDDGTYIVFSSNVHITLGKIIEALSTYVSYYSQKYENYENSLDEDFQGKYYKRYTIENVEKVLSYLERVKSPEVIYFNNSIVPLPDSTLDRTTTELNYYKKSNNNSYVLRYSDNLRPFFCKLASNQTETQLGDYKDVKFYDRYGLNNLWLKDFFKIDNDFLNDEENYLGYKKFAYTNITPLYPSVDYDPIRLIINDYDSLWNVKVNNKYYLSYQTDCGELNYFTPLNKFYGNVNKSYESENNVDYRDPKTWWEEWKWFDISLITPYTHSFKDIPYKVAIYGNNKENIEEDVINYFLEQLNSQQQSMFSSYSANTLICAEYFKQLYNIYYDFKGISIIDKPNLTEETDDGFIIIDDPQKTGDEYVAYKYEVYAVLK